MERAVRGASSRSGRACRRNGNIDGRAEAGPGHGPSVYPADQVGCHRRIRVSRATLDRFRGVVPAHMRRSCAGCCVGVESRLVQDPGGCPAGWARESCWSRTQAWCLLQLLHLLCMKRAKLARPALPLRSAAWMSRSTAPPMSCLVRSTDSTQVAIRREIGAKLAAALGKRLLGPASLSGSQKTRSRAGRLFSPASTTSGNSFAATSSVTG